MKPKKTQGNLAHTLTKMFLGTKAFSGGRPNKNFFAVYNFFKQRDNSELCLIKEYLEANNEKPETMKELYYLAQKWSSEKSVTKIESTKTTNYLELILKEG